MKTIKSIQLSSIILILSLFAYAQTANAQKGKKKADKETIAWRYELEAIATGVQGTYQIKAWSYSKNVETAIEQAKKNAVHGIIFKGFPNKGRIQGQKPLARDSQLYDKNKKFFKNFFKTGSGDYMKFVTLANNGNIAAGDRIKLSKKEYKIGVIISVNVSELRKHLEDEGLIKSLSDGF
ncbi:MAG: hypothetical protein L3J09_01200 [Flavobacteriaceae bacterium]|nr:hypothetical protein [Flavobacteriaceae bacterium]